MKLQRTSRIAALLCASTLALAACSDDDQGGSTTSEGGSGSGGSSLSGTLNGGGSSAQEAAMEAWRAGFGEANPGVTVNYDPAGSSAGREQFLSGGLAFAGSDAALDEEEIASGTTRCEGGNAIDLPLYISPIAVIYNLEGVEELNLDAATTAKIFNVQITKWNDPAIQALNEGVELPDLDITAVHRQDGSGTTNNFTDYLADAAGSDWPYEADSDWTAPGGEAAQGTSGVVAAVEGGNGTIGYADLSRAEGLGVANIKIGEEFVAPSAEGAAKAVETAERVSGRPEGDISLEIDRATTDPTDYPITLVAYSIVCTSYPDAAQGELVKAFFTYVASEEGQQAAADNAGSAPISDALRTDVLAAVEAITAG